MYIRTSLALAFLVLAPLAACGDDGKLGIGATCTAGSQCESGACVDNVCVDPATIPDSPAVAEFHFAAAGWGVRASPNGGMLNPSATSVGTLRFERGATGDTGTAHFADECRSDAVIGSPEAFTAPRRTVAECGIDEDEVSYTVAGHRIELAEGGEEAGPALLALQRVDPLVAGGDVYAGYARHALVEGDTEAREVELLLAARASVPGQQPILDGDYGAVRLLVGHDGEHGELEYDLATLAMAIDPRTEGGTSALVTYEHGFGYLHNLLQNTIAPHDEGSEGSYSLPFAIAPDGALTVTTEWGTLRGAVAPSANFFFLVGGDPEPDSARGAGEPIVDDDPSDFHYEVLVAVRRALTPQLAGKEYALIRHELFVAPGAFEVGLNREGRLVFDATGAQATLTWSIDFAAVGFAGGLEEGLDGPEVLTFAVTVDDGLDAEGMIRLVSDIDGDVTEATGFAQSGERVLVLGDWLTMATEQDEGSVGLAIGVCLNCD